MRDLLKAPLACEPEEVVEVIDIVEVDQEVVLHDLGNVIMAMAASIDRAVHALPPRRHGDQAALADRLDALAGLLDTVLRSGRLAGRLVNHLRAGFPVPVVDQRRAVDVLGLANDAVDAVRALAGQRIALAVVAERQPLLGWGHADPLARALMNVVINAIESLPAPRRGAIEVRVRREVGWVVVEVADDGPGMDPDEVERVRGRGVSGKGSTGLGLTSCADAMMAAGGTWRITSVRGLGTTVALRLPAVSRTVELEVVQSGDESD